MLSFLSLRLNQVSHIDSYPLLVDAPVVSFILSSLWLTRPPRITAHDFDPFRLDIALIIQPKIDVLDQEGPDFVTESISIEMALDGAVKSAISWVTVSKRSYLELHARFDFLCQHIRCDFVEGA